MASHRVRVFEVDPQALPGAKPPEVPGFAVEADSFDGASAAAEKRLTSHFGYKIRGLSHVDGGGLVAYVTKKEAR